MNKNVILITGRAAILLIVFSVFKTSSMPPVRADHSGTNYLQYTSKQISIEILNELMAIRKMVENQGKIK